MEITKENFTEELENIEGAIEESTFLSIDGEFTGLDIEGCSPKGLFDTPAERYSKLKNGSTPFLLLQFGLCAFKLDQEKQMYEAKPYNFYLFPSPLHRSSPDKRFMCQSSSIDFLVSHGLDFNKVFQQGIPYLSAQQERQMRSALESKHMEQNNRHNRSFSTVDIPEDQKEYINNICEKIDKFLEGDDSQPFEIRGCNAFQRRLIYQTVEERYPLARLETKTGENKERYLLLHGAKDAEELAKIDQGKQALEMMELESQVGFTKIFQAVSKSGKLVVGHNMFLDILHCVTHFHGPLPDDLDDFKSVMQAVFPKIVDTKLMANTPPLKEFIEDSSLGNLHSILQSKPFAPATIRTASGFEKYNLEQEALHEAGYDAFVTGCCFATMCKFLGRFQKTFTDLNFLLPSSPVIEAFVNKLFVLRIADIQYINLSGADVEVNRDHVFHVTFPQEWRASDLIKLFEPYGKILISWLTSTTAYVGLDNKKNALKAFEALSKERGSFHVNSYAFHHSSKRILATAKRKNLEEAEYTFSKIKRHFNENQKTEGRGDSSVKKPPPKERSQEDMEAEDGAGDKLFDESTDW